MEKNLETPAPLQPRSDCLSPAIFLAMLAWVIAVPFIRHLSVFTTSINPTPAARWPALIGALVQIFFLGGPLLAMALLWPRPRYKAIYQTWLLASLYALVLLPVHLLIPWSMQTQAALQIVLSLVYFFVLLWLARRRSPRPAGVGTPKPDSPAPGLEKSWNRTLWLLALLVGSLSAYPWLAWGAFGSLLDTLLQGALALLFGLLAVFLIDRFTFLPLRTESSNLWGDFFLGGLGAGGALLILASGLGYGFSAMQILLMIVLPSLGWMLSALNLLNPAAQPDDGRASPFSRLLPLGFLIGLVAAAPLALVDPDELVLIVSSSPGELLGLTYQAATISTLILLACGFFSILILWLRRPRPEAAPSITHRSSRLSVGLGVAALTAVALGAIIYFVSGQPGLYGERMFVILEEQADISSAASIQDYSARRQFVYQTLVEHANSTQTDLRQSLDRLGIGYTPYYLVNALEINGNPLLRLWLMSRPEVDRILDSPHMRPLPEEPPSGSGQAESPTEPEWNLTNIGADRVWREYGVTGQGIVVGQSDSGVQGDHPELAEAYRGKNGQDDYNWFDPWNHTTQPVDIGGHGTHTLGSILGQHTGVAPGASWIACVNLARNLGNPALYLDCMQFMLAPFPLGGDPLADGDPTRGAHVLNNSWGCPEIEGCDANTFLFAVRALRAAGIFVVVSAGNDGPNCNTLNTPPPIYQEVFSVGAIDRFGELASFSSIGPVTADGSNRVKPDLLAPGVQVLSSLPESSYGENSGTSMAGPHVVGVVALLWSANPSLIGDIDRTVQILIESAQPYVGSLPDCPGVNDLPSTAAGYGILDAYAAVKMALGK